MKVSFFLPSMWKFLAPPTMLRAKCGLGLWIERSAEKLKKQKMKKTIEKIPGKVMTAPKKSPVFGEKVLHTVHSCVVC